MSSSLRGAVINNTKVRKYDKQNIGRFRYLNILITFVTASHTHRAQYIFLRLEYFFTRSRRNGARKRAIASRKPRRLNFHSIQWNARMTSLPSILSPRARHDRGAVPRRGANAGVQPCDAVFSASWKIFKYRNLQYLQYNVQYVLFVISYHITFVLPYLFPNKVHVLYTYALGLRVLPSALPYFRSYFRYFRTSVRTYFRT